MKHYQACSFHEMLLLFQVTVRDNGTPPLSSTTRVIVQVEDINDHGPEFEQKFYTVRIPASPNIDKPLFQVKYLQLLTFLVLLFSEIALLLFLFVFLVFPVDNKEFFGLTVFYTNI